MITIDEVNDSVRELILGVDVRRAKFNILHYQINNDSRQLDSRQPDIQRQIRVTFRNCLSDLYSCLDQLVVGIRLRLNPSAQIAHDIKFWYLGGGFKAPDPDDNSFPPERVAEYDIWNNKKIADLFKSVFGGIPELDTEEFVSFCISLQPRCVYNRAGIDQKSFLEMTERQLHMYQLHYLRNSSIHRSSIILIEQQNAFIVRGANGTWTVEASVDPSNPNKDGPFYAGLWVFVPSAKPDQFNWRPLNEVLTHLRDLVLEVEQQVALLFGSDRIQTEAVTYGFDCIQKNLFLLDRQQTACTWCW